MYIAPTNAIQHVHSLSLKPGQIVRGKVLRHLDGGRIMTRVQSHSLVARTGVQVSVGDLLVMYVKKLHPKPQLQVLHRSGKSAGGAEGKREAGKLLTQLLDQNLPVSRSLYSALTGNRDSVSSQLSDWLIPLLREKPGFWQRMLYHAQLSSPDELQLAGEWLHSGSQLSAQLLQNRIMNLMPDLPQFSIAHLDLHSVKALMETVYGATGTQISFPEPLARHLRLWSGVNYFPWENSAWAGALLPFFLGEYAGLLGLSLWNPGDQRRSDKPARLALVGAFGEHDLFHGVFEYRTSDFAGVVEAGTPRLQRALEDHRNSFHKSLESSGYRNVAFRVNYTPGLTFDFTRLIPGVPATQTYQV